MIHTSAERAVAAIEPDDVVIIGHAEPSVLVRELCKQADRLRGLRLIVWPLIGEAEYLGPEFIQKFRIFALSGTHGVSRHYAQGLVEYIPAHVTQILHRRLGGLMPTVSLLQVAPLTAGEDGYSLGIMADYSGAFVGPGMRLVIAEANQQMPSLRGPNRIPEAVIDLMVDSNEPIVFGKDLDAVPTPEMLRIAELTAGLIPDEATIQIGATGLANAIVRALRGKKDLGFHSGVLGPAVTELMDAGTITNARKPLNRGVSVAATVHGNEAFIGSLTERADVEVWPNSYTHDLRVLAQLPKFIALNSCLQVDVTGQVYSETVGGRLLGTTGGQGDFMRGAAYSEGGRGIIALPATTRDGRSRVIAGARSGDLVSLAHTDVDFIVSEYGVAELSGKPLRARVEQMVRIAAPQFRSELERYQSEYFGGEKR